MIKNEDIPPNIILVNSTANNLELIIADKLYWKSWKYMNNVIYPPKNAKNNVLVVVPNMSLPMFIPDKNNSFIDRFGLLSFISYKADDIAIEVSFIVPISPIIIMQLDNVNISSPVLYTKYPIESIVSSGYPWIYILLFNINVIIVNIINNMITDINEDIVFLFVPFRKNNINILIIIHNTRVGMVGLKFHPAIRININSKIKLRYIVI